MLCMEIYLDNAATTKPDKKVLQAMLEVSENAYANSSSPHSLGKKAYQELEQARTLIAKKLNANPSDIIFTSGATESNNLVLKGIAQKNKGCHIITSQIEHKSILEPCKELEKQGCKVTYLSVSKEGFVDLKKLEEEMTNKTTLVSI